ncbi:MAG: hypothetical protein HY544_05465 [Candidatus Diapherotrites archaeon]|uniref:Uncharacterized protein n=1 Tax=Candidatus Iainarchaeum sp. TaxID=3101447 RepID=A0A8T3YS11_9ARCH|nr:hypothetical protein [Candidatus Diapherotrites archaeon]
MSRKAQTEVIGLAFIVMLMIIGIVLAVIFLKPAKVDTASRNKQLANAFLNALTSEKLEVADCKQGVVMRDLLVDCAVPPPAAGATDMRTKCPPKPPANPTQKEYCTKAEEVARTILQRTFEAERIPYRFKVSGGSASGQGWTVQPSSGQQCSGGSDRVQMTFFLPPKQPGPPVSLELQLCEAK